MVAQTKHTPRLEARFGAHEASVIDMAHPDAKRTRAGGHQIARFSRITYDGALATKMALAQEMADALLEVRSYINSDKLRWSENANLPVRQFEDRLAALLAKIDGAA